MGPLTFKKKIMRRSTFRTRVVTVFNKSRPCHKLLVNHLYIVSHNWTGEYHQTGQEQSLSVIIQDNITQVPWHTHKPVHITHTHTHSVSHVLWHTSYTPVKCDQVLIYCRQYLLLSWMLTFSWLCVSRDLWDPFIANNQCSCPCWWYFVHTHQ